MKIEFTDEEVAALPEEVVTKLKDNKFDGDPGDFIPDVNGLKSALEKTRDEKRELHSTVTTIRETLGLEKTNDIAAALKTLVDGKDASKKLSEAKAAAKDKLLEYLRGADGIADRLIHELLSVIDVDPESGEITVPGEDGVALLREDGEKQDHTDIVAAWKKNENFGSLFRGTRHSGGGAEPGKGLDGPGHHNNTSLETDAPPKTMKISDMSTRQRMLAATVGGGLEEYRP